MILIWGCGPQVVNLGRDRSITLAGTSLPARIFLRGIFQTELCCHPSSKLLLAFPHVT